MANGCVCNRILVRMMSHGWCRNNRAIRQLLLASLFLVLLTVVMSSISTDALMKLRNYAGATFVDSSRAFVDETTTAELSPDIYSKRLKLANDMCFGQKLGNVRRIASDKQQRLANCIVPKVGCTYWINIFRYLNNDTGGVLYDSPFDIPRWFTHYGKKRKESSIPVDQSGPRFLSNTLRFMFVREPYSRLWSAWIDKYWLPDFWVQGGKGLAKEMGFNDTCAFANTSFITFLRYITSRKQPEKLNEHWASYKYICDPCKFRPHVIAKIETFTQDTRYILDSVNLTWVLNPPSHSGSDEKTKHVDHSLQEMRLLTEYNIFVYKKYRGRIGNCSSIGNVFRRIWTAFQYNGHIPDSAIFPFEQLMQANNTVKSFLQFAEESYLGWTNRKAEQKPQKKRAMLEAYKQIPTDVMEKLQTLYSLDFEMFGYDKRPKELYEHR